jgi:hypothetical protein
MRPSALSIVLVIAAGCSTSPLKGGADLAGGHDLAAADLAGVDDLARASDLAGVDLASHADLAGSADLAGPVTPTGDLGGACVNGTTDTQSCGNCGTMTRTCSGGQWQAFGACGGQGECAPGATDTTSCGSSIGACMPGTATRTCSATCSWSAGACGGAGYVGPTQEVCGDGIDNDCNGVIDEGCTCAPAPVGQGGSVTLPFPGAINTMISDPGACLIYAVYVGFAASAQLYVFDTGSKSLLATIELPYDTTDIDISPNGKYLVVAHAVAQKISVIDKTTWTIGNTLSLATNVQRIEVSDAGLVYYISDSSYSETHRLDLSVGASSDTIIGTHGEAGPDIELSRDGSALYSGPSTIGNLTKFDVSGPGNEVQTDVSAWSNSAFTGFFNTARWVFLAPGGQHVYYAGYQLDPGHLASVNGYVGERVLAEDAAGTFAIGQNDVFDTKLMLSVARLPEETQAAALTAADREVWYAGGSGVYYQNVDDFLAGVPLGQRARAPEPLANYTFTRLVADPVRPRVYGLDAKRQLVVAIDTTTGLATGAIVTGSLPSDIDVAASGGTLWVAQEGMLGLGKIDLASWQFTGFVYIPRDGYDVATIGDKWVVAVDYEQKVTPTLIDASSGTIVDSLKNVAYQATLAAAGDGKTLFIGDSGLSSSVRRYDVSSGAFVNVATSTAFNAPSRALQTSPDGSFVYYAGNAIEGTQLQTIEYAESDTILDVTRDNRLAISATAVYRASDGTKLGALPVTAAAQALSPDGKSLYVVSGGALQTVDLTTY